MAHQFFESRADEAVRQSVADLARCALSVVAQRYPFKADHLMLAPGDAATPEDHHPVFGACYDWHSSVHMHWSLLRLMTLNPGSAEGQEIARRFRENFTAPLLNRELAYFQQPGRCAFERPYGWAWLLKLQSELDGHQSLGECAAALRPLSQLLAGRLRQHFERLAFPVRGGMHSNSAFAMVLALEFARSSGHSSLEASICTSARRFYGTDASYPARYEPSGGDFLSAGLCEAVLMAQALGNQFSEWWASFCPEDIERWLQPVAVTDKTDPQDIHFEGLNLSRAWCLRRLARALPAGGPSDQFSEAASRHWEASFPHVTQGDFVATHWLVTFALLR